MTNTYISDESNIENIEYAINDDYVEFLEDDTI